MLFLSLWVRWCGHGRLRQPCEPVSADTLTHKHTPAHTGIYQIEALYKKMHWDQTSGNMNQTHIQPFMTKLYADATHDQYYWDKVGQWDEHPQEACDGGIAVYPRGENGSLSDTVTLTFAKKAQAETFKAIFGHELPETITRDMVQGMDKNHPLVTMLSICL